jgi:hypothetical protein
LLWRQSVLWPWTLERLLLVHKSVLLPLTLEFRDRQMTTTTAPATPEAGPEGSARFLSRRPPGGGGDHCSRPEGAGKTTITTAQVSLRDKDLADPSGPAQRVAGAVVVVISMSRRSGSCCGASP